VLQLRRDQHQVMKATIEQISTITPAAIAKIPIHFQIPPSSSSSGVMSPASCFSVPVVDLNTACDVSSDGAGPPVLSLQSATLLPVPQLPFEAHALRDPKRRDHTTFDCLAALCGSLARPPKFPPPTVEVSGKGVMLAGLNLDQQLFDHLLHLSGSRKERLAVHIAICLDIWAVEIHPRIGANSYIFCARDFRSFSDNSTS
jgi:hypothetical protein